jgi:hypothetical protein
MKSSNKTVIEFSEEDVRKALLDYALKTHDGKNLKSSHVSTNIRTRTHGIGYGETNYNYVEATVTLEF